MGKNHCLRMNVLELIGCLFIPSCIYLLKISAGIVKKNKLNTLLCNIARYIVWCLNEVPSSLEKG